MHKHHVGRKIPSFVKVNVNKVDIFYGIVLIKRACCSFRNIYTFIILTIRLCAHCSHGKSLHQVPV